MKKPETDAQLLTQLMEIGAVVINEDKIKEYVEELFKILTVEEIYTLLQSPLFRGQQDKFSLLQNN